MNMLLTVLLLAGSLPAAAGPLRVSMSAVLHPTARVVLEMPLPTANAWSPGGTLAQVAGNDGRSAWLAVEPHPRGGLIFAEHPAAPVAASRPTHWAMFELTDEEVLKLNIVTRGDDGRRVVGLSAARAFDVAVGQLRGQFREIEGNWSSGDNLAAFNDGIKTGLSLADAARRTWTGRQAARHGFTEAEVVEDARFPDGLGEVGGSYRRVVARFRRPRTAQ